MGTVIIPRDLDKHSSAEKKDNQSPKFWLNSLDIFIWLLKSIYASYLALTILKNVL